MRIFHLKCSSIPLQFCLTHDEGSVVVTRDHLILFFVIRYLPILFSGSRFQGIPSSVKREMHYSFVGNRESALLFDVICLMQSLKIAIISV